MAIVGINFGSATGGSGFDVTATVASIVANLKNVESPWTTQIASLKAQDTVFSSIGTDLASLSTSLQALTDFQGVLASKLGSSSNADIVSLGSAGPTAVAGSHTIVVSQLAQTSSASSDVIPLRDTLNGALTFQVGTGAQMTIAAVSGSSDTLATYAAAVNLAGIGVSASVVSDTTGARLSFISNTSGSAGQLTVTSGGTVAASTIKGVAIPATTYGSLTDTHSGIRVGLHAGLDGLDAKVSVDGLSIISASNTISAAIRGVTFQVLSANPDTQVQVQIVNDTNSVASAFTALIAAYNVVAKDIKTQEGNDASGKPEPLFGNPVMSQIQSTLSLALTSGNSSGSVDSLYDLGITANQDGTLSLNASTLESLLNSNYVDVVGFLQNAGSFGSNLSTTLNKIGNESTTGVLTLVIAANSSQENTFNADIVAQDAVIADQRVRLTNQLNAANEILQAIPQLLNEVDQLYSAMTGYNTHS